MAARSGREAQAVDANRPAGGVGKPRQSLLERLVFGLDAALRRRHAVIEYSADPRCVLRIQIGRLDQHIVLSDGTCGSAGDPIIDIHLWNEQVPAMPRQGASIAWARQMSFCFRHSLRELARYLAARSDLDDISVLRANLALGGSEQQMLRLMSRYGFEPALRAIAAARWERVHRFGENLLISLMVLAHNAAALRGDTLRRGRTPVFLSRRALEQRYGRGIGLPDPWDHDHAD